MSNKVKLSAKIISSIISVICISVALAEGYRWHLLNSQTKTVSAKVTATQINPCNGRGCSGVKYDYQIKYRFSPNSNEETFTYTGQQLFRELWVRVPESLYLKAKNDHLIDVRYSISNPRINQPTAMPKPKGFDTFGFSLLAFFALFVSFKYWRNKPI